MSGIATIITDPDTSDRRRQFAAQDVEALLDAANLALNEGFNWRSHLQTAVEVIEGYEYWGEEAHHA